MSKWSFRKTYLPFHVPKYCNIEKDVKQVKSNNIHACRLDYANDAFNNVKEIVERIFSDHSVNLPVAGATASLTCNGS